ncbi:MAG TPA: efflux RND transporter periplasmic adaptor subunit [Kofleriaceae bacterium]|jgi:RND family efflux transporter MFP subunit|nr:efflux RND transporter periplasmic adaptor subunit [Kofleriaceae bacterium]
MNQEVPLPSATAGRSLRLPMVVCFAAGALAILLARHYRRPDPPAEPAAPGMKVGSNSVALTSGAPAWKVIKLGAPTAAEPHWSDPIPGRVAFDEAKTSRLGSPLAGRVTAVLAERGQHVKSGTPLFTVSSPSLAELRTELARTGAQRTTAHTNLDRVQALVDAGSLPAKELVTAKQEATEADLAVQLAEHKLSALKVVGGGDTSFTVSSPRDGVVVEKAVAPGQLVDPSNGSLMAIADLSTVWVVADLFESDVGVVAPGTRAKVSLPSSGLGGGPGGSERDAVIEQVSAVVDPDRHTVPVRLRLDNPDGALRPNAYATIRWFDPTPVAVTLPSSAVLSDGAKSYVYRQEPDGALRRHDITVGSASAGSVPVIVGLSKSDQVVLSGAILLDNQIQLDN